MSWIIFVKYLHIIAAMMMIGGMFARQMVRTSAKNSGDIIIVVSLLRAAGNIDQRLVIPGSDLVILVRNHTGNHRGLAGSGFLAGSDE